MPIDANTQSGKSRSAHSALFLQLKGRESDSPAETPAYKPVYSS